MTTENIDPLPHIAVPDSYRRLVPETYQAPEDAVVYGTVAEFVTPEELLEAARKTTDAGYRRVDTYTPFPVEGMADAMRFRDYRVPMLMLLGGFLGGLFGFFFQLWAFSGNYPYDIGGRSLFSWPYYIVITFEMTILSSALTGIFGMFILNGLPMPYHPIFSAHNFERASTDRFFLAIESRDPKYDRAEAKRFLEELGPVSVSEVFEDDPGMKKQLRGESGGH